MRERIYITTAPDNWNESECIKKSKTYKNVVIYSPINKALFLNSVRYGSVNDISEINYSELFKLSTDKYNVIHLSQNDLTRTFNKTFVYRNNIELHNNDTIKCHVNERIQILSNSPVNIIDNKQYYWVSSDTSVVVIDGNNIITPKKTSNGQTIKLVNVNDQNDIQFTLNLKIFGENNIFSINSVNDNPYSQDIDYSVIDIEHITISDKDTLVNINDYIELNNLDNFTDYGTDPHQGDTPPPVPEPDTDDTEIDIWETSTMPEEIRGQELPIPNDWFRLD